MPTASTRSSPRPASASPSARPVEQEAGTEGQRSSGGLRIDFELSERDRPDPRHPHRPPAPDRAGGAGSARRRGPGRVRTGPPPHPPRGRPRHGVARRHARASPSSPSPWHRRSTAARPGSPRSATSPSRRPPPTPPHPARRAPRSPRRRRRPCPTCPSGRGSARWPRSCSSSNPSSARASRASPPAVLAAGDTASCPLEERPMTNVESTPTARRA